MKKIGIYSGGGSSHSWLWLAETCMRRGIGVVPLDEKTFSQALRRRQVDAVFVSGGDTFALAASIGDDGANALRDFLKDGGTFVGACAGACLMLRSSKEPLSFFNFTDGLIANVSDYPPAPLFPSIKYICEYGTKKVYHPVRGEIEMKINSSKETLVAPIFGGPAMIPSEEMEVLGTFSGFTNKTYFIADKKSAEETYIGKTAIAKVTIGKGSAFLVSPHLEHPDYPRASSWLLSSVLGAGCPDSCSCPGMVKADPERICGHHRELLSEASSLRIACSGLLPIGGWWKVGGKLYDAERINLFAAFFWNNLNTLLANGGGNLLDAPCLHEKATKARKQVLDMRLGLKRGETDNGMVANIISDLSCLCASVVIAKQGECFA